MISRKEAIIRLTNIDKYIYHGTGEYGLDEGYCILGLSML